MNLCLLSLDLKFQDIMGNLSDYTHLFILIGTTSRYGSRT